MQTATDLARSTKHQRIHYDSRMAEWKVLTHGAIETLDARLKVVEGSIANMPLKRVMSIVRLDDGGLLVHNGIALNPALMAELEAWGPLRLLLVPNPWHRIDAAAYQTRYPELKIYCPSGARKRVAKRVELAGVYEDLPATAPARVRYLDGVGHKEGYIELSGGDGVTLIFSDAVFNQPHLPGVFGTVYRLIRSSGGPRVPGLVRLAMVRDRRALRAQLEALAETPSLRRIVVMHGARVDDAAPAFLRQVAATL
jgi:hypothetical protein